MSSIKDKLKTKVMEKYWECEYRLFFSQKNFPDVRGIQRGKIISSYNIIKYKFNDKSRHYLDQSYVNENVITPEVMAELFAEESIIAIEPEDTIVITFPYDTKTLIELTSHYLYTTPEADFTSQYIKINHQKLHKLITNISRITDYLSPYISVAYSCKFIKSKNIVVVEDSPFNRPFVIKRFDDYILEKKSFDDKIIIASPAKTKKVKKSKMKKTKTRVMEEEFQEEIQEEEEEIQEEITYIPKSRQEYFRRAYIRASECKVMINDDNIYNTSIFTKRLYILWDNNIHISFNMKWYFSSEDMNDIVILLNKLYKRESRFRTQVNYYKNILITCPCHFDYEHGNIGNHFTGFFADSEGIEKTKTLHFYIENHSIQSITFKEFSTIEEFV
jgi:hypothetical protein